MRQLSLAQCKALAEKRDQQAGEYEDALCAKSQETHFEHSSAAQLIAMWESGRNLKRRKLSDFEFGALCEAWVAMFDSLPPADGSDDDYIPPAVTLPEPDTMLKMNDVIRLTGLSKSTIQRRMEDGTFPKPIKLSERRNGWPASVVMEWRNTRPS